MFRIKELILFILCLIMLIPMYGCSEVQQTAIESASAPESSVPENNFISSSQEISEPETESTVLTESSQLEASVEKTEAFPKDIDEFIVNDYSIEAMKLNALSIEDWGSAPGYTSIQPCRNGIYLDDSNNRNESKGIYISDSFITSYHWLNGYVLIFAEEDSIRRINLSGEVETIYSSPDGNRIWAFYILKDYLYAAEGDYLYVVNYNTMERRCVCWIGDTTKIWPSADSTKTVYTRRNYYNGEYFFETAPLHVLSESGEVLNGLYPQYHPDDLYSEYFEIDISTGNIKQVDMWTVNYGVNG